MNPAPGPPWTAGQVARQLGIAESTLRAWHRRYGIGPHGSEPGRYRHYAEADVARLRRMLELIKLGMLASDAARAVTAGAVTVVRCCPVLSGTVQPPLFDGNQSLTTVELYDRLRT